MVYRGDLRGGFGNDWMTFFHKAVFSLGDGNRVSFWKDA